MELKKAIRTDVYESLWNELGEISRLEGRKRAEVIRLLLKAGLRIYRRTGSLLCDFPNCTRRGCCGDERAVEEVSTLRQIRLLRPPGPDH